jgi:HAE1 family hydrophobic/amphiphilic exporter-1
MRRRSIFQWLATSLAAPMMVTLSVSGAAAQTALPLTLEEAVRRAVEHNPDLAVVSIDTATALARVAETRSAFVPVFSTVLGRSSVTTPPTTALAGEQGLQIDDWFTNSGIRQRLPWFGASWSVSWEAARTTSNNPITSFDPSLASGFEVAFSQPLLRDRRIDPARHQLVVTRRSVDISELRYQESLVQTVAAVKEAYWTLQATRANVEVQAQSLRLAEALVRENRVRVNAGQVPPLDLVQAEAEVAQRRENLIQARTAADDAEDVLRKLIMDPSDQSFWNARLEPTEQPTPPGQEPNLDQAVANALGSRYDLKRLVYERENATSDVDFLRNQRLPDVRVEASYRGTGLGGTEFLRSGTFPGVITGTRRRSFGDALEQIFTPDYPTWSVGLTLNYPLGNSFEEARLVEAELVRRQADERIASLQLEAAATVRRAARRIRSTAERVDAARAAERLAEQRLESEQRRYEVGLSTTFLVTQAQRDLLQAQVNRLRTSLEYESALVRFEAVQQAPPLDEGSAFALNGATVVRLPAPAPRGVFRTAVP